MTVFKDCPQISIHFSKVINTPIFNLNGRKIGKLTDFFVDFEEVYPAVIALQYSQNGHFFYVNWNEIKYFSLNKIIVKNEDSVRRSRTYPKVCHKKVITSLLASQFSGTTVEYPPLGKVILDRQIVDTNGKKVVRVNDIQFIKTGPYLRVTHASIGLRSMLRRLGYETVIDYIVKTVMPKSKYLTSESLINWKHVHAIPDKTVQKNVKLNLTNADIKSIHPADLADILEDLDPHARELIFNDLEPSIAAQTLTEVEQDLQVSLIKKETAENAAKIIENMGTDEAADILHELHTDRANAIISKIENDETQEEIQELLEYDEDSAGGLMSTEAFEMHPSTKKTDVLKYIQENHKDLENIYDIYIVDEIGKLLGHCSLYKLLIQIEDIELKDIMKSEDILSISPSADWKEVATFMSKYNLINTPVIDDSNTLLGIISVDDILPWLLKEKK